MKNLTLPLAAILAFLAVPSATCSGAESKPTYAFPNARKPGAIDHVVVQLEVGGDLNEPGKEKTQQVPMSGVCNLQYEEKTLEIAAANSGRWRSIRAYDKAAAVIKVGNEGTKPSLRSEHSLVGVEITADASTLFSPRGPLTRDELEVVDVQANSLLLDQLLPEQAVAVGDQWRHAEHVMAVLLGLDAVTNTDVESTLKEVTDSVARFEIAGHVAGTFNDVSSEIELKGKYRYDLRTKRIDWLGLVFKEKRGISEVMRGFDVVVRAQVRITPCESAPALADTALKDVTLEPTPELCQLVYESAEGGWQLTHDRRWHLTGDRADLAAMKFLDHGKVVAQCNISPLPKTPPEKAVSLDEFQDDIRGALGKDFGEFVEAGQSLDDARHRVCRAVVRGEVAKIPIRWLYYLVGAGDGRQTVFAFTLQEDSLDRLQQADAKLVRAIRFVEPKVAEQQKQQKTTK